MSTESTATPRPTDDVDATGSNRGASSPGTGAIRPLRRARPVAIAVLAAIVVGGPAIAVARLGESGSASYGDSEQVGRNRLSAARLDIEVGPRTAPLVGEHVAPGDLLTTTVELVNEGTVPLRYSLTVSGDGDARLAPWLTWSFLPATGGSCPAPAQWRDGASLGATEVDGARLSEGSITVLGDPTPGEDPGDRSLEVGDADLLCVAMTLDLDAPNAVQDVRAELVLTANAEQRAAEPAVTP